DEACPISLGGVSCRIEIGSDDAKDSAKVWIRQDIDLRASRRPIAGGRDESRPRPLVDLTVVEVVVLESIADLMLSSAVEDRGGLRGDLPTVALVARLEEADAAGPHI